MDEYYWEPSENNGVASSWEEAIGQAIGSASVCWVHKDGALIFDSERADGIRKGLSNYLYHRGGEQAHLGHATTRELLSELTARTEVDGSANYKTVGDN